jgi:AcrR family transcriptional regulator
MSPTRDSRQTRQDIIDATKRAIEAKGEMAVRVAKVAREAGVTTGAIYNLFGSREGLLAAAHTDFMRTLVGQLVAQISALLESTIGDPRASDEYRRVLGAAFTGEQADQSLRWAAVAARSQHQPELATQLRSIEREILDSVASIYVGAQKRGWMRSDVDARAIAVISLGGIVGMSVMAPIYGDDPAFMERLLDTWRYVPRSFASEVS